MSAAGPNALTPEELEQIAAGASTLEERVRGEVETVAAPHELVQKRLERWLEAAAVGDAERFARRLAWDALDDAAVRRALGTARWRPDRELPPWCVTLAALLARPPGAGGARRFLHPEKPTPFEEVLAPFVTFASDRLALRAGAMRDRLSAAALGGLERALFKDLHFSAGEALQLEYSVFRALRTRRRRWSIEEDDGRDIYDAFLAQLNAGRLRLFFLEYPVLARLVATAVDQWIDASVELLERLAVDEPLLVARFGEGRNLGGISTLEAGISDRHQGGRSAAVLGFESGLKLVYKPRDLSIEEGWFDLLRWLNARGAPLPLRVLQVVDRGTHGWVEFAEHAPCASREEAGRYYRRSGMLLGLVYALQGSDCHLENVIASGEQPVLVDLETVMHPALRRVEDGSGLPTALEELARRSVLRSGMLPQWVSSGDRRVLDFSALGASQEQEGLDQYKDWLDVNTNRMRLGAAYGKLAPGRSVPVHDGAPVLPQQHAGELERGFREIYRLLMDLRDELLADRLPRLAGRRVRLVFRSTRIYALLLMHGTRPELLRDGADRSVELDAVSRALSLAEQRPELWPLVAAERRALEANDIPAFTALSDAEGLDVGPGRTTIRCFDGSCLERVRNVVLGLDAKGMEQEAALIRASLTAQLLGDPHGSQGAREGAAALDGGSAGAAPPGPAGADELDATPLADEELVAAATAIADELREQAIGDAATGVGWITIAMDWGIRKYRIDLTGFDLYNGVSGVALFMAALSRRTGDPEVRGLAMAALEPSRRHLRRHGERITEDLGIGGGGGLGGLLYALAVAGDLLADAALLEDARWVAGLVTERAVAADAAFDVIGGSAGAILGLLALHRRTGGDDLVERAAICGRHLLRSRAESASGARVWKVVTGEQLAGFAHGAAGIAYALLRLHGETGDASFREAAEEAIRFEQAVFSVERGNWPDLRQLAGALDGGSVGTAPPGPAGASGGWPVAWCHGAAGIALARAGGLPWLDVESVRRDIEAGSRTTLDAPIDGRDHLCCGGFGRADILLEMGRRLGRPELIAGARELVARLVRRAERDGSYRYNWRVKGVPAPGLYSGASGIGYALLRQAAPGEFPCLLLWD